jgi:hypothetical protein
LQQKAELERKGVNISMKRLRLAGHFMAKPALSPDSKAGARAACRGELGSNRQAGCWPGLQGVGQQGAVRSVPASTGRLRRTGLMRVQSDAHPSSTFTGFGRAPSRPTRALHRMPQELRGVAGICAAVERQPRCWMGGVGGTGELQPRSADAAPTRCQLQRLGNCATISKQ